MDQFYIGMIVGGLVFIGIAAYIFLMFFYPEIVGISGPESKKAIAEENERHEESLKNR